MKVSASGKTIAVGAAPPGGQPGKVWVFTKATKNTYTQTSGPLVGAPSLAGDTFGWSLALSSSGKILVAGAPVSAIKYHFTYPEDDLYLHFMHFLYLAGL